MTRLTHIENGCRFYDNCFTCPFDDCKLGTRYSTDTAKARVEVLQLCQAGHTLAEIAKTSSKSVRTIRRWIDER